MDFPSNRSLSSSSSISGSSFLITLEKNLTKEIEKFCQEVRVSTFQFFMSIYTICLYRYTNQTDFVIGFPYHGRSEEFLNLMGHTVNVVPFRIQVDPNLSFLEYLKLVTKKLIEIQNYQDYPLFMILKDYLNVIKLYFLDMKF